MDVEQLFASPSSLHLPIMYSKEENDSAKSDV